MTHDQTGGSDDGRSHRRHQARYPAAGRRLTELYDRPANVFVAGFIGSPSMNLNTHPVVNGKAKIGEDTVDLPAEAVNKLTAEDNGQIVVGFPS